MQDCVGPSKPIVSKNTSLPESITLCFLAIFAYEKKIMRKVIENRCICLKHNFLKIKLDKITPVCYL